MEKIVKTYDNGLRMVVEQMPNFKSVTLSVMIGAGSGDELPNEFGLSHFCEHMLFKGTEKRTNKQLLEEFSRLGVDYNAWTSESATCYHIKGIADNLEQCMEILSDMYFNLKFTEEDFDKEGNVIVQEIKMHSDVPYSEFWDLLNKHYFKGTKFEHPVAGFAKDIKKYKSADIYNYIKKHYIAPKTIISLAGDITLPRAEKLVQKYFLKNLPKQKAAPQMREKLPAICPDAMQVCKKKKTAQQHVALLFPVCTQFDKDCYPLNLLAKIMAGDMSSRLFIEVREKLGLVYSIATFLETTEIGGYLAVKFSCTPQNTKKVITVVCREIDNLLQNGVTEEELQRVKNRRHTRRLFDAENTMAVNERNAEELREFGKIKTTEEYLQKIDKITTKDIEAVIHKYFDKNKMSTIIYGK